MSRDFDGASGFVNLGSPASLDNIGAVTYAIWMYARTTGENTAGAFFAKDSSGSAGFKYFIIGDGLLGGTQNIAFQADGTIQDTTRQTSDSAFALGQWNHVAVTWDGSVTATNIKIYVNGIEASYQTTTNGSTVSSDAALSMYIGNRGDEILTFDGLLAFASINAYVMNKNEINQIMKYPGSIVRKLRCFLPLYGSISPEPDYSSNKNNGTVSTATKGASEPPINGIFTIPKPDLITVF